MKRTIVILLFATLLGCNRSPLPQSTSENGPVTEPLGTQSTPSAETTLPTIPPTIDYLEKAEVESLVTNAAELESDGKLEDALELANKAVALDPDSPLAATTKKRLEDRLRKI